MWNVLLLLLFFWFNGNKISKWQQFEKIFWRFLLTCKRSFYASGDLHILISPRLRITNELNEKHNHVRVPEACQARLTQLTSQTLCMNYENILYNCLKI